MDIWDRCPSNERKENLLCWIFLFQKQSDLAYQKKHDTHDIKCSLFMTNETAFFLKSLEKFHLEEN